jgi:hypothetical protein
VSSVISGAALQQQSQGSAVSLRVRNSLKTGGGVPLFQYMDRLPPDFEGK